jgi:hypothetical protein
MKGVVYENGFITIKKKAGRLQRATHVPLTLRKAKFMIANVLAATFSQLCLDSRRRY